MVDVVGTLNGSTAGGVGATKGAVRDGGVLGERVGFSRSERGVPFGDDGGMTGGTGNRSAVTLGPPGCDSPPTPIGTGKGGTPLSVEGGEFGKNAGAADFGASGFVGSGTDPDACRMSPVEASGFGFGADGVPPVPVDGVDGAEAVGRTGWLTGGWGYGVYVPG